MTHTLQHRYVSTTCWPHNNGDTMIKTTDLLAKKSQHTETGLDDASAYRELAAILTAGISA